MDHDTAIHVPLEVWPDAQGNPLLILSEHLTLVYLGCWEAAGVPADYVCKIDFQHGWASRTMSVEFLPYEIESRDRSSVYEVIDSGYLKQASEQRLRHYPEWKNWDTNVYRHFVISGHDIYVEVIAESFHEERVAIGDAAEILPLLYQEYAVK
jgi:hypothetical protein